MEIFYNCCLNSTISCDVMKEDKAFLVQFLMLRYTSQMGGLNEVYHSIEMQRNNSIQKTVVDNVELQSICFIHSDNHNNVLWCGNHTYMYL